MWGDQIVKMPYYARGKILFTAGGRGYPKPDKLGYSGCLKWYNNKFQYAYVGERVSKTKKLRLFASQNIRDGKVDQFKKVFSIF